MTRTPSIRLMYMNTIVQKLMTYPLLIAPLRDGYGKGQSYIELILEMKNEPFSSNDLVGLIQHRDRSARLFVKVWSLGVIQSSLIYPSHLSC